MYNLLVKTKPINLYTTCYLHFQGRNHAQGVDPDENSGMQFWESCFVIHFH